MINEGAEQVAAGRAPRAADAQRVDEARPWSLALGNVFVRPRRVSR